MQFWSLPCISATFIFIFYYSPSYWLKTIKGSLPFTNFSEKVDIIKKHSSISLRAYRNVSQCGNCCKNAVDCPSPMLHLTASLIIHQGYHMIMNCLKLQLGCTLTKHKFQSVLHKLAHTLRRIRLNVYNILLIIILIHYLTLCVKAKLMLLPSYLIVFFIYTRIFSV